MKKLALDVLKKQMFEVLFHVWRKKERVEWQMRKKVVEGIFDFFST